LGRRGPLGSHLTRPPGARNESKRLATQAGTKMNHTHSTLISSAVLLVLPIVNANGFGQALTERNAQKFVPFADFVQSVRSADVNEVLAAPNVIAADSISVESMRQYLLTMYQGMNIGHSYVVGSQTVDCVPMLEQPSLRGLGLKEIPQAPPASAGPAPNAVEPQRASAQFPTGQAKDAFGNALGCEDGTIPMLRITLPTLTNFKSLNDFFQKGKNGAGQAPDPSRVDVPATAGHKYAITYQYVNNLGTNAQINVWRPYVYTDIDETFTLAQSWTVGGSGASLQTLEVGWQNFPSLWDTEDSVPFIFWTADDYNKTGCYNLTCKGFVQVSKAITFGVPWAAGSYSVPNGPQLDVAFQYYLYKGNWWLFVNSTAIGYYPSSLYGTGQLSKYSTLIEFGNETVGTTVWPAGGSGTWASYGAGQAAYQKELFYISYPSATGTWDTLSVDQSSPSCYTATTPAYSSALGFYFYFGGPGGAGC
jgi:hypothetical protein